MAKPVLLRRFLGVQHAQRTFGALIARNPEKILLLNNLDDCLQIVLRKRIGPECETAAMKFRQLAEGELRPAIDGLPKREREHCLKDYEAYQLAVNYATPEGQAAIAALVDAVRSGRITRGSALSLQMGRLLQAASNHGIEPEGLRAKDAQVRREFQLAYQRITRWMPLHSTGYNRIYAKIFDHAPDLYISREGAPASYGGLVTDLVQGPLFERYLEFDPIWSSIRKQEMIELLGVLKKSRSMIGQGWRPHEAQGNIWIYQEKGWKQTVDSGLFGVRDGKAPQCFTQFAMQAKGAKKSEGVGQTIKDEYIQPVAWSPNDRNVEGYPTLIRFGDSANSPIYQLIPRPDGQPTKRYLYNVEDARIPKEDLARLRQAGIQIEELRVDSISAKGLRAFSKAMIQSALITLGY